MELLLLIVVVVVVAAAAPGVQVWKRSGKKIEGCCEER